MYKVLFGSVLLVCIGLCPIMTQAQGLNFTVELLNEYEMPITKATIRLSADTLSFPALEREAGIYVFTNIPAHDYVLKAEAPFYKYKEQPISITSQQKSTVIHLEASGTNLRDVVVVGNGIDKKIRESALSMQVVDKKFLQQNMGGSLMQSLEKLPGVEMIAIGSGQAKPMIRGMGFDRILVIDKGIRHEAQQWGSDHGLEIDQFAVNQIEIIKGPASFLYGSNAIGGVVKLNPAPPPAKNTYGGSVQLLGKTNNALVGTALNLYARKDRWFASGDFSYQDYGDYKVPTDSVYTYGYGVKLHKRNVRNTAGRQTGINISLGYVGNTFKTTFYISDVYSRSGLFANAHGLEPIHVNEALYDASRRDILYPSDKVNHFKILNHTSFSIKQHSLTLETGFQNNVRQEFNNYIAHGYMPPLYPDTMSIPKDLEKQFSKNVFSFNLNDQFTQGRHNFQLGISGEFQDNKINGYTFLAPAFNQFSVGAFAYDKMKLSSRWILHTALRYDISRIHIFQYNDWFVSPVEENGTTRYEKVQRADNTLRRFHSLTGSVGLNYNLNDFEFKLNIGKSYRTPIAKELASNGVNFHYFSFEKGDKNLNPEESYQLNGSFILKKRKWRAELSPYLNYFPNYIYLNPTPYHDYQYGAGNQIYQYGQSSVWHSGGELSLKHQFNTEWSTELTGEYIYSLQTSGAKKGFTLPFSPPASAILNLTYAPEKWKGFYNPYFSADAKFVASQNNIVPPEDKTKGYTVVNIQSGTQLHLYHHVFDINFQLRNVFNTKYMMHTSFYRLIGLPEDGINFVLSLKMNLDFINKK